jgi:hypothetical protein
MKNQKVNKYGKMTEFKYEGISTFRKNGHLFYKINDVKQNINLKQLSSNLYECEY